MTNKKKNIGLALADLDETYNNLVWPNFVKIAKDLDVNLFFIVGRQLNSPLYDDKEQNIIYNLINQKKFDGLILFSGSLGHFIDYIELEQFIGRFKGIPIVSLNENLKGIPTIFMNDRKGEEELIEHLIHDHRYTHYAFIRGPEGHQAAIDRFIVFQETLHKYQIPVDPTLISAPGNFLIDAGETAVHQFLKTKKKMEVIVCANDEMAIGAIRELNRNGINVPNDIAVVGFDNTDEAIFYSPPITTVKQPYYELCKKAIDLLLDIINDRNIPEKIEVNTKLEIKHSCGCDYPCIKKIKDIQNLHFIRQSETNSILQKNKRQIINETLEKMNISASFKQQAGIWLDKITNQLITMADGSDLNKQPDVFSSEKKINSGLYDHSGFDPLNSLYYSFIDIPQDLIYDFYDFEILKEILANFIVTCLKYLHHPDDKNRLLNLQKIGSMLIDEAMSRYKALESVNFRKNTKKLQKISQYLVTSFNIDIMIKRLAEELIQVDIKSCYIILYESQVEKKTKYDWKISPFSHIVFALKSGKVIELNRDDIRFETSKILPDQFYKHAKYINMILMPLYYNNEHFGYILIELGSIKNLIFEIIRSQISTTIKKVKDYEEDKYSALGMLFSGISHEILNPLGGVFAPLENLKITLEENHLNNNEKINTYINRMENNLLRIENLIKGLRALYYDRVLNKSSVNLLETIQTALNNIKNVIKPAVELKLNIPEDIYISANQQALIIIIQNLLKNAMDAVTESGCIEINYKINNNQKYLIIKDNGAGIENDKLDEIFNAFYTTKEVGKGTGLGLYLVKDLILRMKWEISVNSVVQQGSEFIILIKPE